ncbi:AAA ATPase [Thermaerobacter marianensis DSM 12885]|uniref:AAA ATPase n=1 Tax=Thermaerobacter marianensis (strain ATCC 700841 / DSM 12885 / JCM 10246 / 7p75a) TaxID=644966 RepID=E6SL66_THEM7|nr:ATPase AAA [Thermaerobacter marianensis]ADU51297.1 AAA ATPase [Thermaerobacter marianensis DSM 12885]
MATPGNGIPRQHPAYPPAHDRPVGGPAPDGGTSPAGPGRSAPPLREPGACGEGPWAALVQCLAPSLARRLERLDPLLRDRIDELRITAGHPLWLLLAGGEGFVDEAGRLVAEPRRAPAVTAAEVAACLERMTASSWYAVQEQARQGFLTLPGGHRVGLAGEVQVEGGRIERFRRVRGLVIRRARAVEGCAAPLLPWLVERGRAGPRLASTLLLGPPASGKTTLLRDLARLAGTGLPGRLTAQRVAVVDERGELAAGGAFDLGPRTAVLEHCPKQAGIVLALRALSPEVLITDELGGPGDAVAVADAVRAGVTVVATAHARGPADLAGRRQLRALEATGAFARLVVLDRWPQPGTPAAVYARGAGGRWVPLPGVPRRVGPPDDGGTGPDGRP